MVDDKTKYEEAGRFHRYILSWRHAALAGFLVAMYAVGNVLIAMSDESRYSVAAIVAFLSALLSVAFFFIDQRNRQIYITATKAARAIEDEVARAGLYTYLYLMDDGIDQQEKAKWRTHTIVLTCIYLISAAILLGVALLFLYLRCKV